MIIKKVKKWGEIREESFKNKDYIFKTQKKVTNIVVILLDNRFLFDIIVSMYIRRSSRKYKGKEYFNYVLVESVQTPKGPRQKAICSLGNLQPKPKEEWLEIIHRVEEALSGQMSILGEQEPEVAMILEKIEQRKAKQESSESQELVEVDTKKVETEDHREGGSVHVGYQFWNKLGFPEILKDAGFSEKSINLTCLMVLNRLIHPSSEHGMPDWINSTALSDILGMELSQLSEDSLYRNMNRLYPHRAQIEKSLWERERDLFNLDNTVYLYDLTSTYFEGDAESNDKAQFGYSRDRRSDCKQVVVGLVVNRDGFPIAHEIFDGNRNDSTTLGDMLDALDKRVGFTPNQTIVVDRGMSCDVNLKEIRNRGLHYIVATRQSERNEFLSELEKPDGYEEVKCSSGKAHVNVKLHKTSDCVYALCISDGRKEKDEAIRKSHEKKLLSDLKKLGKRVKDGKLKSEKKIYEAIGRLRERYPRVARYYELDYDKEAGFTHEVVKEKLELAEKLDGSYLLKTDRKDMSAEEVFRVYTLLTRAENAFRNMKSPLSERPIFHQLEHRVDTHIFLCILAYHLLVAIEKTLLNKGVHTSWAKIREELKTHQVCTIVLPTSSGDVLKIRKSSLPEARHRELYDLLEIPYEIMKQKRTWHRRGEICSDEKKCNPLKTKDLRH